MTTEEFQRKLTAILSADVQGYSRLMEEDEDSTVRTLTAYRALMISLIKSHRGHVVDSPGDNLLSEFGSVMDAVRCAVEIQEELRIRNAELPDNRKMRFRIGINLGDVIEEGDRIYGDGINVAARVEGMAEGGGICISGIVYEAIKNKLSMSYDYLGEHSVKNIKDPIRVYRIRMEPEAAAAIKKEKKAKSRTWQWAALSVVAILILGAIAIWYFSFRQEPVVSDLEEAPKTIAVLPFADLSPESDQGYFVDGLSEEILNYLSNIPNLHVTSRTSSFAFKGTNKTIQEIAEILGREYILEGSVRKAGNVLRITAQLIHVADDRHLWSKTYNRELKDIFDIQEDIATAVADELKATFGTGQSHKQLGGTDHEKAYELYLIAKGISGDVYGDFNRALESIDTAIELDPKFAQAWAMKSYIHCLLRVLGPADGAVMEGDAALKAAQKAIELEPNLAEAYAVSGLQKAARGDWIEAELAYRKSLELAGESSLEFGNYYNYLFAVGYHQKANKLIEASLQNDPFNQDVRGKYIMSLVYKGDMQRAKEQGKLGATLFSEGRSGLSPDMWLISINFNALSLDDFLSDEEKVRIKSQKDYLAYLHQKYTNPDGYRIVGLSENAAYFGDPELAIAALEKAVNLDSLMIMEIWLPVYHEVRQLPRFKEIVNEIGLVDYWNEFGWPDMCHKLDNGDFECD